MDGELNPEHPVTQRSRDQWHKIALLIMLKLGVTKVEISADEIAAMHLMHPDGMNILLHEHAHSIELRIVSDAEAVQLAGH